MTDTTRRDLLAGAALGGVALTPLGALAQEGGDTAMSDAFTYEVDLSEAEWRARLTPEQFHVLRDWGTEERFSSDYAAGFTDGHFRCQGCDLALYEGRHKVILPIGWVFFAHSVPNAVLTDIDQAGAEAYGAAMGEGGDAYIEAHCRRCGGHLGHVIPIDGQIVHCVNGTAMQHVATELTAL